MDAGDDSLHDRRDHYSGATPMPVLASAGTGLNFVLDPGGRRRGAGDRGGGVVARLEVNAAAEDGGEVGERALRFLRPIRSFAVDQPRYPEPIDNHAKARGPERLLEWHRNPAVLAQLVKNTLGLSRALDLERERETFGFLVAVRCY